MKIKYRWSCVDKFCSKKTPYRKCPNCKQYTYTQYKEVNYKFVLKKMAFRVRTEKWWKCDNCKLYKE